MDYFHRQKWFSCLFPIEDYILLAKMDTVDLYSNQLLPMPHPHAGHAPPSHHSPLPPLSSTLSMPSTTSSQGKPTSKIYILRGNSFTIGDQYSTESWLSKFSGIQFSTKLMVKCAFHQFIRTTLKWNSVFPRICGKLYSTVLYCRNYIFHIFCGIQFF